MFNIAEGDELKVLVLRDNMARAPRVSEWKLEMDIKCAFAFVAGQESHRTAGSCPLVA